LAWIALNQVSGIGPAKAQRLVEVFQSPLQVFNASVEALAKVPGINADLAERLHKFAWREKAEWELAYARKARCRILTLEDADYPPLLRAVELPPPVLYVRGHFAPTDLQALAVVGCRRPSPYGLQATRALAGDLAQAGFTIVSGLARGIDTAAHEAALEAGGRTLAVLAHGLDLIYPPENRELHDRITDSGAAISEFALGMPPQRENFPQRNRVISGLARGVLVVEAGLNSGALITARWAVEQGREVFALPGRYDASQSQGAHALIQDGAKLVTGLQDLLDELPAVTELRILPGRTPMPVGTSSALTQEQQAIYQALESGSTHIDALAAACALPVSRLLGELLHLEMQGRVQSGPGGRYHWIGK